MVSVRKQEPFPSNINDRQNASCPKTRGKTTEPRMAFVSTDISTIAICEGKKRNMRCSSIGRVNVKRPVY